MQLRQPKRDFAKHSVHKKNSDQCELIWVSKKIPGIVLRDFAQWCAEILSFARSDWGSVLRTRPNERRQQGSKYPAAQSKIHSQIYCTIAAGALWPTASPPKKAKKNSDQCELIWVSKKIPGIVLLSHSQIYSTIAAGALNYRVREGNVCFCSAIDTGNILQ